MNEITSTSEDQHQGTNNTTNTPTLVPPSSSSSSVPAPPVPAPPVPPAPVPPSPEQVPGLKIRFGNVGSGPVGQAIAFPSMSLPETFEMHARHCDGTTAAASQAGALVEGHGFNQAHVPQLLLHLSRSSACPASE
eukprot:CAMPEP_0180519592 /NCGR_PEP_ID=MMETSP1036_2-20121128/55776_1 /TAXON_ID=632150 /ORGANISM="Azadinium spinosum, Strain 3D9" /LENGTH=134 /DNA_ID=CAMNT_0022531953 /DNA_START=506 /DNA_END=911 /DNA_ORIENTATION=-